MMPVHRCDKAFVTYAHRTKAQPVNPKPRVAKKALMCFEGW